MSVTAKLRRFARALLRAVGLEWSAVTVWLAIRRPERLRHAYDVWRDYRRFTREFAFLRDAVAESGRAGTVGPPPRRVLVISLSDFVAQVKAESMLAKALELQGAEPWVVTNSDLRRARRYFAAFGYRRFVEFDTYFPPEVPASERSHIADLFAAGPTFASVKAYRFGGVDVGRQALATVLRGLHQGKLDFEDERTRAMLRQSLEAGVSAVIAARRVLDEVCPAMALINDAQYSGVGALFESALNRRIPVVQWLGSQRDDALTLKRFDRRTNRLHPVSVSDDTWALVSTVPWTQQHEQELLCDFHERYIDGRWESYYNRPYGTLKTRAEAQRQLGLDQAKRTATIFAHILWDSTLFWGEDLFDDYQDWLVETVRAACGNPAVNWIVKLHPGNAWKLKRDGVQEESIDRRVLREQFGDLPDHVKLLAPEADLNTYSVFAVTDYCLTVRGTVGIEAAALEIPVYTAGTGRYSGLGFTIDCATRQEYVARLASIQDTPPLTPAQIELAKKYAHALFVMRPARFDTFRIVNLPLSELGHPLDHNVRIAARSAADLRRAPDLQTFARWALESRDLDFLTEVPVAMGVTH